MTDPLSPSRVKDAILLGKLSLDDAMAKFNDRELNDYMVRHFSSYIISDALAEFRKSRGE